MYVHTYIDTDPSYAVHTYMRTYIHIHTRLGYASRCQRGTYIHAYIHAHIHKRLGYQIPKAQTQTPLSPSLSHA